MLEPLEYKFLQNPYWGDSGELIKTTIQQLCVKRVLKLENRWVQVDRRHQSKRSRPFLILTEDYNSYDTSSSAERFILSAFAHDSELALFRMRNYIKFHFKKSLDPFKSKYVIPDVRHRGLCFNKYLLTSKGRGERNLLTSKIQHINNSIDELLLNVSLLSQCLNDISINVISLEKSVLEKIYSTNELSPNLIDFELYSSGQSSRAMDLLDMSTLVSWESFSFDADMGGFDGFGGGDFGGAGAGLDW